MAPAPSRTAACLRLAAISIPGLALLLSSYLLSTYPGDKSYECPGSTYTLLGTPAVGGAPEGFFDAVSACNEGALSAARAAVSVMLTGLSLALVVAALSAFAARAERERPSLAGRLPRGGTLVLGLVVLLFTQAPLLALVVAGDCPDFG